MAYVIAVGAAIAMAAVQALLLRAVARAASAVARAGLLAVKQPLWAGFFIVLALADKGALLTGGLAAGAAFPVAAWLALRTRPTRKEG